MTKDTTEPSKALKHLNDYVLLGRSGLRVSPLCLGALTFGQDWGQGFGADFEEAKRIFCNYVGKGGNFFDTANIYTAGTSERFLGQLIAERRSQSVVATKYTGNPVCFNKCGSTANPNAGGNHRKNLVETLDGSLKRLGIGDVDILYVHMWEYRTPIDEVLRALDDTVRSGKAHYVAISDAPAWVVSQANAIADIRGWTRFIGLQTRYNLLNRSMEWDLQPMAAEVGLGIIPWGTIAEGFLTGKHTKESIDSGTGRNESITRHAAVERNWEILNVVKEIAHEIHCKPVQVALNWICQKPGVTAPLIGAKSVQQLEDNLASLDFTLTPEQMQRLDEVSDPESLPFPHNFIKPNTYTGGNVEMPDRFSPLFSLKERQRA